MEMEAIWARIEAHLEKHPALTIDAAHPFFNPPATEEEILAAEAALGLTFPADFRASLKLHNGQARHQTLLGLGPLLSIAEIVEEWRVRDQLLQDGAFAFDLKECVEEMIGEGVKDDAWWNRRWVPITRDGAGDHDCLDMDPAAGGSVGQVIGMWHDVGSRPVNACSFSEWVARAADDLEAGRLVWEDDAGFFPKEEEERQSQRRERCE